jgi:hypothetical protein
MAGGSVQTVEEEGPRYSTGEKKLILLKKEGRGGILLTTSEARGFLGNSSDSVDDK